MLSHSYLEHFVVIFQGALDLKDKTAADAMVPIDVVFMLDSNAKLDLHTMNSVSI